METKEGNTDDSFLKIDTIWSEADIGNLEHISVKEEVLDLEPECIISEPEPTNGEVENFEQASLLNSLDIESFKQKIKQQFSKISNNEKDLTDELKPTCLHDKRNFKIVKRKLRCGDCRSLVCPECWKVVVPNLQTHFSNGSNHSDIFICKICHLFFYSSCAHQAHVRTHSLKTPYVCPDCGLIYNHLNYLTLHLINKCYHVYKVLRYKCKGCSGAYLSHEMFLKHIYEQHIQCLMRCSYCSKLCTDSEEFNLHIRACHQNKKVYILKYFRCSLCSNIVKPRFMLEKHMTQHCSNPECLEVDYQCLCGYMYSYIGAFRAHIEHCNQKGLLPPRWSFLRKQLKHDSVIQIRDGGLTQMCQTDFESKQIVNGELEEFQNVELIKANEVRLDREGNVTAGRSLVSLMNKNEPKSVEDKCVELESEVARTNDSIVNETLQSDASQGGVDAEEGRTTEKESEPTEATSKIVYDHIPCDHLGYVSKTQNVHTSREDVEIIEVPDSPPTDYQPVTELNERTGVITTKNIPIEEMEEIVILNKTDEDADKYTNVASSSTFDKAKTKSSSLHFDCPFCMTYFPKHVSLFQQFILHLESYHPDAALNIVIPRNEDSEGTKALENSENCSLIKSTSVRDADDMECVELADSDNEKEKETPTETSQTKDLCWSMELSFQRDSEVTSNNRLDETEKTDKEETFGTEEELKDKDDSCSFVVKTEEKSFSSEEKETNSNVLELSECETSRGSSGSCLIEEPKMGELEKEPKARRESEVWSELYESLMVAEKLKSRKEAKSSSEEKSLVSNFSAKRVVKKPKRYGESSESGSGLEIDNSASEGEQPFQKALEVETPPTDSSAFKKQKLISKLQNVDSRFVDYLFHLINRNEKYHELYKKHLELKEDSHSQDLQIYRKKVLNGIKHKAKPVKLLRYKELLLKKEDKVLSDGDMQTPERKRGRPRKVLRSVKVKERRRSDKEVHFIEKNFDEDKSDATSSKRKRKLSSKLQYYKKVNVTEGKDDFSSGLVITSKVSDANRKLTCAVCKEAFPEMTDFREHIVTHRMEENTYQCMECGECFVVKPSLEKHLHAFHKIRNTDKYIEDNGCCSVKKEVGKSLDLEQEAETETEPLRENQCKVCKDQFERAIDLTKHFRIHGMAFLKEFRKEAKTK